MNPATTRCALRCMVPSRITLAGGCLDGRGHGDGGQAQLQLNVINLLNDLALEAQGQVLEDLGLLNQLLCSKRRGGRRVSLNV